MNILVFGQSNAVRWFRDHAEGATSFVRTFADAGIDVTLIDASRGSTALLPSKPENWLADGPDSLYGKMLTTIGSTHIDAAVWIQGETDALNGATRAAYQDGLSELFGRLRADVGNIPVYMQKLLTMPDAAEFPSLRSVQAAQLAYAASDPDTVIGIAGLHLCRTDGIYPVHFDGIGYDILGNLAARTLLDAMGHESQAPTLGTSDAESMRGTAGADRIYAMAGRDHVTGGAGDDFIYGERGPDVLIGGAGDDTLGGGVGNDILRGGRGADILWGEDGADTLIGGHGADVFYIDASDTILDYTPGVDTVILGL